MNIGIWIAIGALIIAGVVAIIIILSKDKKSITNSKAPVRVASLPPLSPTGKPGASVRATIVNEMSYYKPGDVIRFEFGTLNTDAAGGTANIMNIHASLPDGTVGVFNDLVVQPGEYAVRYMDYVVKAVDFVDCSIGCRVRASMTVDGVNNVGNTFSFKAEKSAAVQQ